MKTPPWFLALVLACSACHSQSTSQHASEKAGEGPAAATATKAAGAPTGVSTALPGKLALLQKVDLAAALADSSTEPETKRGPMEGFYGPTNYRISFFFTKVARDAQRPEVYHIWGKNRYKKVITAFTGTCTVKQLIGLADTTDLYHPEKSHSLQGYSAIGDYTLAEDPATKGAGVYSGKVMLDFFLTSRGQVELARSEPLMDAGLANPSKGSGLLFQGEWRDNKTGKTKATAWSSNFLVIVPEALEKIGLGSRADTIYPELAKYGWNEYWENDEWWTKPTRPTLSL